MLPSPHLRISYLEASVRVVTCHLAYNSSSRTPFSLAVPLPFPPTIISSFSGLYLRECFGSVLRRSRP